jgi:hypothetical protein
MTKEKSPEQGLGGFEIISNMLTGPAGPQDLDDPIREPVQTPNIDDDDDLGGVTDFDEKDNKPVTDDPIIDPPKDGDDPIVDPPKTDDPVDDPVDTPADKPADDSGDNIDMSEYQEDIANYLKSELESNLGWEIPEDYEIKSMEDVVEFMKELTAEASKPTYASDEVAAYDEFVKNGGSLREFYANTAEGKVDTESIDVDNEFNQKIILKEHLKNQGYSDAQIDRRMTRYDEAGVLEAEATDALEMLKEHNEKEGKRLLESQQNEAERIKNEQLSFITNVEDSVKGLETIRGIKISEKDRNELLDYILRTDSSGSTQYQKDYMSNIGNLVESAYFTKNGQALIDKSKKQGQTEAYRSLHQKLKTNKGNKGKSNEGRDYSDSASSGLGLIGKQLLG